MKRSERGELDKEQVRRCLAGEQPDCQQLFQRLLPQIRGTLFRVLGPDPEYEDLVQETMLEIFRGMRRYRGDALLATWADRVCVNVARQRLRHRSRRIQEVLVEDYAEQVVDPRDGPAARTEQHQHLRRVYRLLEQLSPPKRIAFVLFELCGRSVAEVAEATEVGVATAKSRIWHARRELLQAAAEDPQLRAYVRVPQGRGDK